MTTIKPILAILATGYILMFYSEHLFWARLRPDDNLPGWLATWFVYSLLALAFLILIYRFRIHTLWALFLAGAVFGWLAEGVIVQTAYESLPLSISFTGLSWHALISVWLGWYSVRRALQAGLRQTFLLAATLGLLYGFWAISWWLEPDGGVASPFEFLQFVIVTSLLLMLAYWIYNQAMPASFSVNRKVEIIILVLFVFYYLGIAVPVAQFSAVVLPALLAVIYLALRHNRAVESRQPLSDNISRGIPIRNYLGLLALPVVAASFYAIALKFGWSWQTNWIAYLVTTPAGFILLVISLVKVWRSKLTSAMAIGAR